SNELSQSIDKILLAIESIKEGESQELGSLKEEIIKLLGEARSKPISLELSENLSIDLVRSLWLFGYQLYRSGYYQDAYNVLENVSNILKDTSIYFKDDAFYFMALSSYEVGNIVMASQLFSKFITLYPDSEYVPHAKYFLERMSGAGK
ncbi:tetratricopeptide repeat protein, partial [Pseudothermotoga lettingae]